MYGANIGIRRSDPIPEGYKGPVVRSLIWPELRFSRSEETKDVNFYGWPGDDWWDFTKWFSLDTGQLFHPTTSDLHCLSHNKSDEMQEMARRMLAERGDT